MFGVTQIQLESLRTSYVGKTIEINHLEGENCDYDGRKGVVKMVDDIGQLHGSWGGIAVNPETDTISIVV